MKKYDVYLLENPRWRLALWHIHDGNRDAWRFVLNAGGQISIETPCGEFQYKKDKDGHLLVNKFKEEDWNVNGCEKTSWKPSAHNGNLDSLGLLLRSFPKSFHGPYFRQFAEFCETDEAAQRVNMIAHVLWGDPTEEERKLYKELTAKADHYLNKCYQEEEFSKRIRFEYSIYEKPFLVRWWLGLKRKFTHPLEYM